VEPNIMIAYLTPEQVCEILQISQQTLKRMRMRGNGPPYLVLPNQIRYPRKEFEEWLASRTVTNTAQRRCRAA